MACCYTCKNFSELKEPREFPEGYTIHGYCFRKAMFAEKYPAGHPVYVPGGQCKAYILDKHRKDPSEPEQLELTLEQEN